jgi:Na+/H+-dicarboxylate symporter
MIIAVLAMIAAWLIAAKEALDLEWLQTIVTVFLGWLALVIVSLVIGGLVLGVFGLGAAALGGLLGS